jgi:hypothetical protein
MADWTQDDFQDGQGQPRNALRCVEGRQNFGMKESLDYEQNSHQLAAGGQWLSFRNGNGEHTKRKCAGPMDQDNTDCEYITSSIYIIHSTNCVSINRQVHNRNEL